MPIYAMDGNRFPFAENPCTAALVAVQKARTTRRARYKKYLVPLLPKLMALIHSAPGGV
jgi:hypothetical protein